MIRRWWRWLHRDGGILGPKVWPDPDGGPGYRQWY